MRLYRHYKNKPYTLIGIARHSETLEEMVIYETRYENSLGKIWVRPKEMFFENVVLQGTPTLRFQQVPLEIISKTSLSEADIDTIAPLIKVCFGEWDAKWFHSTFDRFDNFYLLLGYVDKQLVAFKLGYEIDKYRFQSWLGGVIPEYRGLGIASDLIRAQQTWCSNQGYKKILTKSQNRFREMLSLNIKTGFSIVGTDPADPDGVKILLELDLANKS